MLVRLTRMAAGLGGLMLAACSPVSLLNATIRQGDVAITRGIAYGADPRQTLDVYRPPQPMPGRPMVVFLYGGSWNSGSRSIYPFVATTLAHHGVLVVVPDYRLYPQVAFPTFLDDCATATMWARDHGADYGADPRNLFLMGHSAGAYNAAMLALDPALLGKAGGNPDMLRGMIGLAGPYDFLPMTDPEVIAVFNHRPDNILTQPIHYVRPDAPPMLLLAGSDDRTVLPRNSINLAAALRRVGAEAEDRIYPGVGHIGLVISIAPIFSSKDPALADTLGFIERHGLGR